MTAKKVGFERVVNIENEVRQNGGSCETFSLSVRKNERKTTFLRKFMPTFSLPPTNNMPTFYYSLLYMSIMIRFVGGSDFSMVCTSLCH